MNCPNRRCWRVRRWMNLKGAILEPRGILEELGEEIEEVET